MFEKNLKYYRLKNNMTKRNLADACNVTPMAISNYESGKRFPDIETLNKLAAALDVHVADFLETRNENLEFRHCEFRKNSKLSKGQQDFVRESVEVYFGKFFDAIECLSDNPLPAPVQCHELKVQESYQANANALRQHLRLSHGGPIDKLITILENMGFLIFEIEINNNSFFGMNGMVDNYPYIVINKNMRAERKRTTIIHELAHIMFNWEGISHEEQEKKATAIAGAFLISDEDLLRELGTKRTRITRDLTLVCEEYGISMYLLVFRANQVGIISDNLAKAFYIDANKAGWNENEPNRVKKAEEPLLFKQLVCRAINEEGISIHRGAEFLDMPVTALNEYCGSMEVIACENS